MKFDLSVQAKKGNEFLWNLIGGMANASTTVILLIATTQIVGDKEAGIFSLAIANAQLFITLGNFGIRPYQATDFYKKFEFNIYYTHRIITCTLMIAISLLYCFVNQMGGMKLAAVVLFTVLKMVDAYADVFEGYMQQIGRLDLAGFALFFRTLMYSVAYVVCLIFTQNILLSAMAAIGVAAVCVYIMLFLPVEENSGVHIKWNRALLWQLTKDCFSLFLVLFLMIYLVNAPKYAIENLMSDEQQTYYNIIYMPAQIINLMSAFAFKPLLTTIKKYWEGNAYKKFIRLLLLLIVWIGGITLAAISLASLWGISILQFVYGTDLQGLDGALRIILIGGGFNAVSYLLYYTLTAIRCQRYVLFCYGVVAVVAIGLPNKLVKLFGMEGAASSFLVLMFLVCILMNLGFIYYTRKMEAVQHECQKDCPRV